MKKVTCTRCGGTGKYSFNLLDGDMCYGCEGKGYTLKTEAQIKAAEARKNSPKVNKREEWRITYYVPASKEVQEEAEKMFPSDPYQIAFSKFEAHHRKTFQQLVYAKMEEKGYPTRY